MKQLLFMLLICATCSCQDISENGTHFVPFDNAVYGIDISHHQGKIDWKKVKDWKGHTIRFVYIKATEGSDFVDKMHQYNSSEARKNGFLVGSYHYFRTTSSPETQFENFVKKVDKEKQDLIPLVDIEEKRHWSTEKFHENLKIFLDLVENHYGKKPMIYTVNSFYNAHFSGRYKQYKFLIGRYGKNSPFMKDNHEWTIWQFTESGKIKGIPKPVDIDVLHSDVELKSLLLKRE